MKYSTFCKEYPTKEDFVAAVKADPSKVRLDRRAWRTPFFGSVLQVFAHEKIDKITVTNEPWRTWTADVTLKNGKVMVT